MSADEAMLALARTMMSRAYAPYSKFPVGAVIRGANGKLYGGCNVENAAYPNGTCAEASAICVMVADGEKQIAELLLMGPEGEVITPCGSCRQRLREFRVRDFPVHLCGPDGLKETVMFDVLLPRSFGPTHLGK